MLLWINGPFGVGKTSTAATLVAGTRSLRVFDPELVGAMLRANLPDLPHDDFQDLSAWRTLVPRVAAAVADLTGDTLVAVQTVLREAYWQDIKGGLIREEIAPVLVVLDCEPVELERRIRADSRERKADQWRLAHIASYLEARPWLIREADLVVDTTRLTTSEVAARLLCLAPQETQAASVD